MASLRRVPGRDGHMQRRLVVVVVVVTGRGGGDGEGGEGEGDNKALASPRRASSPMGNHCLDMPPLSSAGSHSSAPVSPSSGRLHTYTRRTTAPRAPRFVASDDDAVLLCGRCPSRSLCSYRHAGLDHVALSGSTLTMLFTLYVWCGRHVSRTPAGSPTCAQCAPPTNIRSIPVPSLIYYWYNSSLNIAHVLLRLLRHPSELCV